MRTLQCCGAAIVILAFLVTACSKKSSSPSNTTPLGTIRYTMNGQVTTANAVFDTGKAGTVTRISAMVGLFPGSTDSARLVFGFLIYDQSPWVTMSGLLTDTSSNHYVSAALGEVGTSNAFIDQSLYTPLVMQITSNNGTIIQGTFSGHLYYRAINVNYSDSVVVSNGSFNLVLQ